MVAFFLPLAFAALSYPLPSMVAVGAMVIAGYTLLAALTGCLNRRGVEEAVEPALAELADGAAELSLIVVDLDGFKEVNDAHGHAAGDQLIRLTAQRPEPLAAGRNRPGRWVRASGAFGAARGAR